MAKKLLLIFSTLIILGMVYWITLKQPRRDDQSVESNQASGEQATQLESSKTLEALLDQAKVVELPNVNTDGWQTYRSDKLGFEFKYPKGWVVKETVYNENGDGYFCVKTIDDRFARIPTSSSIVLQGDECVFDIRKSSGPDDIEWFLKYYPNALLTVLRVKNTYRGKLYSLQTDNEANFFYIHDKDSAVKLKVYEMDRKLLDADRVLQNIVQTFKPIKK